MAWNPQIGIYNWVGNEGNKTLKVYFYKKIDNHMKYSQWASNWWWCPSITFPIFNTKVNPHTSGWSKNCHLETSPCLTDYSSDQMTCLDKTFNL